MIKQLVTKFLVLTVVTAGLAGCEVGAIGEGANFQKKYSGARKALEEGNYDLAARNYAALIPSSGPLAPRLRLEYAHALLRAGRNDEAAQVANMLASEVEGGNRAAALAVEGTALHESALADMQAGRSGAEVNAKLRRADVALSEMLSLDAALDPLGAMQSRRAEIARSLGQG